MNAASETVTAMSHGFAAGRQASCSASSESVALIARSLRVGTAKPASAGVLCPISRNKQNQAAVEAISRSRWSLSLPFPKPLRAQLPAHAKVERFLVLARPACVYDRRYHEDRADRDS